MQCTVQRGKAKQNPTQPNRALRIRSWCSDAPVCAHRDAALSLSRYLSLSRFAVALLAARTTIQSASFGPFDGQVLILNEDGRGFTLLANPQAMRLKKAGLI